MLGSVPVSTDKSNLVLQVRLRLTSDQTEKITDDSYTEDEQFALAA